MVLFHNRLTHSLKVAQVGMSLADQIRYLASSPAINTIVKAYGDGIDSRVVRAAGLAHDLGHPPFGHIAERELQKILDPRSPAERERAPERAFRLDDSFEGNAQTFRILTKLAFREPEGSDGTSAALDLTRATLRAVLKYPWLKNRDELPHEMSSPGDQATIDAYEFLADKREKKWGAYESERVIFEWARGDPETRLVDLHGELRLEYRTIEAQAMDWADDITYAVHDVEDFYRAGLVPLHILKHSKSEFQRFVDHAWPQVEKTLGAAADFSLAERAWRSIEESFPDEPYNGSRNQRQLLHQLARKIITDSVMNISIENGGLLLPGKEQLNLVELLKEITWQYVIKRSTLQSARRGQARLIRELYGDLLEWVEEEGAELEKIVAGKPEFGKWIFPARLYDFLDVAFSEVEGFGCTSYEDPRKKVSRAVVDYICSLTEGQAVSLGARLKGTNRASMMEHWLQT